MASKLKKSNPKKIQELTHEKIIEGFEKLKAEQQKFLVKLSKFEADCNDYQSIISSLQNLNRNRRCIRMVGGVVHERKIKEVLPTLVLDLENLKKVCKRLKEQISKKEAEINRYVEKYIVTFMVLENPASKQEEEQMMASGSI